MDPYPEHLNRSLGPALSVWFLFLSDCGNGLGENWIKCLDWSFPVSLPACANSTGSGWPWKDLPVDQWAVQPRDTGECTAGAEQEARVCAWPRPYAVALIWHHRSTPSGGSGSLCLCSVVQHQQVAELVHPWGGSGKELVGSLISIAWEYDLCWIMWWGERVKVWMHSCDSVSNWLWPSSALAWTAWWLPCNLKVVLGESRLLSSVAALPCQARALV